MTNESKWPFSTVEGSYQRISTGLLPVVIICAKSGFFDVFINYLEREGSLELAFVGSTKLFRVLK